jgi:purine-binding chemotaxis protein CheW
MARVLTKEAEVSKGSDVTRKVVATHLDGEVYGIEIASIHSVLTPQPITSVPNVSKSVLGVMNLRGRILPVIDLRTRFGLPALDAERTKTSRIVIVEADGFTAGIVVDAVSEVLTIGEDSIEPPSALLGSADSRCLAGIGRVHKKSSDGKTDDVQLILLLDIVETLRSVSALSDLVELQ